MAVTHEGRRNRERPLRTVRDSLMEGLRKLIDDVDRRGNLNDGIVNALDKSKWAAIVKKIIRVNRNAFNCGVSEHDSSNESGYNNDDNNGINGSSANLRRNTPIQSNDNVEDKCKTSSNRIIEMPVNASRRQALQILRCATRLTIRRELNVDTGF